jgi:hypothetical protein
MQQHTLELSKTLDPSFNIGEPMRENEQDLSTFELSMLCGTMVHPMASFSINTERTALSIEWVQEYPI